MRAENGIAHVAVSALKYQLITNGRWILQPFESPGDEVFQGVRMIDSTLVNVWHSKLLQVFIAQGK